MESNKLGLKIVRVSQGLTDLLPINDDKSWSNIPWDIREDLKNVDNLSGYTSVLMLTNIDTGHLLTVATPIGGRPGDFICAWVYVPVSISIKGKELVELINAIKQELFANERNDAKLTELFSKSYEIAPAAKIVSKCSGNKHAYRYYGQGVRYTLSELLDDMCQSYYKDYKSIFLLDKADALVCSSCDDLTAKNICSMIVVKSPGVHDSFIPYIDGQPFTGQIYVIEGDTMDIEWRKSGYRSIHTVTTVSKDMQYSRPMPNQYVRVIPYDNIRVVDEINRPIREYRLTVANRAVESGCSFEVSESIINNVPVQIVAEGYMPVSKELDLTQVLRVRMVKQEYSYEYKIPLKNDGEYCSIKISGDKNLKGSPVKGYELEEKFSPNSPNYLRFEPLNRRFWIACIVTSLLLLGGGFWVGYVVPHPEEPEMVKEDKSDKSTKVENRHDLKSRFGEDIEDEKEKPNSIDKLKGILEKIGNDQWARKDTQDIPELDSIFESMNTYDFDQYSKYLDELIEQLGDNTDYPFIGELEAIQELIIDGEVYQYNGIYDKSNVDNASITFETYKSKITTAPREPQTGNRGNITKPEESDDLDRELTEGKEHD